MRLVDDAIRRGKLRPADRTEAEVRALVNPVAFAAEIDAAEPVVRFHPIGTDEDLYEQLYEVRRAVLDLRPDQETRRAARRVGRALEQPNGTPSESRDRDLRTLREFTQHLDGDSETASALRARAKKLDELLGKPGPKGRTQRRHQISEDDFRAGAMRAIDELGRDGRKITDPNIAASAGIAYGTYRSLMRSYGDPRKR